MRTVKLVAFSFVALPIYLIRTFAALPFMILFMAATLLGWEDMEDKYLDLTAKVMGIE